MTTAKAPKPSSTSLHVHVESQPQKSLSFWLVHLPAILQPLHTNVAPGRGLRDSGVEGSGLRSSAFGVEGFCSAADYPHPSNILQCMRVTRCLPAWKMVWGLVSYANVQRARRSKTSDPDMLGS